MHFHQLVWILLQVPVVTRSISQAAQQPAVRAKPQVPGNVQSARQGLFLAHPAPQFDTEMHRNIRGTNIGSMYDVEQAHGIMLVHEYSPAPAYLYIYNEVTRVTQMPRKQIQELKATGRSRAPVASQLNAKSQPTPKTAPTQVIDNLFSCIEQTFW